MTALFIQRLKHHWMRTELYLHQTARNKKLIDMFDSLNLCINYDKVLDIKKFLKLLAYAGEQDELRSFIRDHHFSACVKFSEWKPDISYPMIHKSRLKKY